MPKAYLIDAMISAACAPQRPRLLGFLGSETRYVASDALLNPNHGVKHEPNDNNPDPGSDSHSSAMEEQVHEWTGSRSGS